MHVVGLMMMVMMRALLLFLKKEYHFVDLLILLLCGILLCVLYNDFFSPFFYAQVTESSCWLWSIIEKIRGSFDLLVDLSRSFVNPAKFNISN